MKTCRITMRRTFGALQKDHSYNLSERVAIDLIRRGVAEVESSTRPQEIQIAEPKEIKPIAPTEVKAKKKLFGRAKMEKES